MGGEGSYVISYFLHRSTRASWGVTAPESLCTSAIPSVHIAMMHDRTVEVGDFALRNRKREREREREATRERRERVREATRKRHTE